jgi:glycosyltransferase involved in cell wall biosynthesis
MPARRLLIFSYYFPPNPSIGGARWAAMSEWLRRAGHEVTVITSKSNGFSEDEWVLRTLDLGAMDSVRRLLRRAPAPPSAVPVTVHKPPPWWFTDVLVPDEFLLTWAPSALARARRLVREREIDCVITSGPPHSTHLLPPLLGGPRPAWIADLRDGWRFESLRTSWPTRAQDRLDALLERRALRSADAVVGVTAPIADDAGTRLGVLSAHVPNGWNPALDVQQLDAEHPPLDSNRVNLVYTGTLSGPRGRDPRPLFAAVRRLAVERPAVAARLRLVLAGRLGTEEERLLRTLDLCDRIEHLGNLSLSAAIGLQRAADALLLLTAPEGNISEATGKLFDYLSAGRPILALARENVAAKIVRETGTGVVVAPDDVGGIARALEEVVDGKLASAYAPRELDRYIYPGPAKELADLVEQAIAQRAGARERLAGPDYAGRT